MVVGLARALVVGAVALLALPSSPARAAAADPPPAEPVAAQDEPTLPDAVRSFDNIVEPVGAEAEVLWHE